MTKKQEELMKQYQQMIMFVKDTIGKLESDIKRIKVVLDRLTNFDLDNSESLEFDKDLSKTMGTDQASTYTEDDIQIVEGKFDGYFMLGPDQKKYPVHPNYASKTKLVPGDMLKLRILPDGKFIYKLIHPAERKHIKATLSMSDDGKYIAVTDDAKVFFLNQAAVTFFKGKPGDKIYILINEKEESDCAAIEAIIQN